MNFLARLFGKAAASTPRPARANVAVERDNVGTRYDTQDKIDAFWMPYVLGKPDFPFIFCDMADRKTAMDAMLALPPFRLAKDSGDLICTEVLQFGVYPQAGGSWGFFLAGSQISLELFNAAVASCNKHNGKDLRLGDPPKASHGGNKVLPARSETATFEREEKVDMLAMMRARGIEVVGAPAGGPRYATKKYYRASTKRAALDFLQRSLVDQPHYYLVVLTPEGNFGRDKDGIYEQPD